MARSRWKFAYFDKPIWKCIFLYLTKVELKTKQKFTRSLRVNSRSSFVPMCLYYDNAFIHNGRNYIVNKIYRHHVGCKFGEFAYTRKIFYYPMRKKQKPRK